MEEMNGSGLDAAAEAGLLRAVGPRASALVAGGAALRAATSAWRKATAHTAGPAAEDVSVGAAITPREERSHEGDAQPWMLVDVARSEREAAQSARWSLKAHSFRALEKAEADRRDHFSRWSASQAATLCALQRQVGVG